MVYSKNTIVNTYLITLLVFMLMLVTLDAKAIDSSVLHGEWTGSTSKGILSLKLDKNKQAMFTVGQKIKYKTSYDYTYGNAPYPYTFLSYTNEEGEHTEYNIYVVIGNSSKDTDFDLLVGFLEISKLVDEKREIVEIESIPISLQKKQ